MGLASSVPFTAKPNVPGQTYSVLQMSHQLGYEKSDIDKMYSFFSKLDSNNDGLICIDRNAFGFCNENKDFLRMIFRMFDDEGKGAINFEEFLIVNFLICSYSKMNLVEYAFRTFVKSEKDALNKQDIILLVNLIWGYSATSTEKVHTDLNNRLAQSRTGSLTLLEFVFFLKENPACIAPIDTLQSDLKKNILSTGRWKQIKENRLALHGDKTLLSIITTLKTLPVAIDKGISYGDILRRSRIYLEVFEKEMETRKASKKR